MDWLAVAVTVCVLSCLWVSIAALRRSRHDSAQSWLPPELLEAELVWSEREFRCEHPFAMVARVDRVYRRPDGVLVLVEFKRRAVARVYRSDIVQLSAQRYVLQRAASNVSACGYIGVAHPDGRIQMLAVRLEGAAKVEQRLARMTGLRTQGMEPSGAIHPAICHGCLHRDVCKRRPVASRGVTFARRQSRQRKATRS